MKWDFKPSDMEQKNQEPQPTTIVTPTSTKVNWTPNTFGHGKWIGELLKKTIDAMEMEHTSLKKANKY